MRRTPKPARRVKPMRRPKMARRPKPLKRKLTYMRTVQFDLLAQLSDKQKNAATAYVQQYADIKARFIAAGRSMNIPCPKLGGNSKVSIEKCFCACEENCGCLDADVIKADGESLADFMEDFIRFQRLVNLLCGVLEGDTEDEADEGPNTQAA